MTCRNFLAIAVVLACSAVGACGDTTETDSTSTTQTDALEYWPKLQPALPTDPALEQHIAKLLAQMSIEEKVGQLIQAEIKYATPEDVKEYHLGSILNGGGTFPNNDKFATPQDWLAMADAYYEASMDTADGGVAIPVIWGSDAVHGHNNVVGATLFPHNIGLGATRDPDLIRRIGAATAREVAATGVNWTFAPTIAVVRDDRWGRTFESYSEDPDVVRSYAREMIDGIQGNRTSDEFLDGYHLVSAAKHFLGDGGTQRGIDRGDTRISEQELAEIHAAGYISALQAGVQTIMASFNSWNGERLHGHKYLLTDILKGRLGFDGFVVGDWNGHRFVPGCNVESCPQAINAGLDMFMAPSDWKALYKNTLAQAKSGEISTERLDDAVTRILRVKMRAGLFERDQPLAGKDGILGSAEHRAIAREAVRKSLVLLKNNGGLLPLNPHQNILVAGDAADNIAKQSGGWTISWQGTGNTDADFPGATSIYDGIRSAVDAAGGEAALSIDGNFTDDTFRNGARPDVAVVVFGEEPYAEWHGDLASIEYQLGIKSDLKLLQQLQEQDIPVVSVFISGRPLWVNKEMNASDAFIAAWLPGSEGAGVADVLLTDVEGQTQYDFVGRLSFTWPRLAHQTVLNRNDEEYKPLFSYGYGLHYGDHTQISNNLPVDSETYAAGALEDAWLLVSRPRAPWGLYITEAGQPPIPVTGNRAESKDGNITIASIDMLSQEDARQIQWRGDHTGSVALQAEKPQDLTRYLDENAALTMDIRVDHKPASPISALIACGPDCSAELPLQQSLTQLPQGEWSKLSIDLQCFVNQGADFSQVSDSLILRSEGTASVAVANIKYVPASAADARISCRG